MRHYRAVDLVAVILAGGLVGISILIGLALIVNVAEGHNPTPTLGENTTQVLTTVLGGLIGVLGSYIGYSLRGKEGHDEGRENQPGQATPQRRNKEG